MITNVRSICNSARYLVCSRCSFPLQFAAFTSHMTTAKRVHQHLKSTADFRLHFNGNGNGKGIGNNLAGYSDSDWANDSADHKSQGGHVFLASNGGAVSWQSRKQGLFALSTLEAEFIACSEASREAEWLLRLQKDIHGKDLPPLPINCDMQGDLALITMGIIKAPTKHIEVCYHIVDICTNAE